MKTYECYICGSSEIYRQAIAERWSEKLQQWIMSDVRDSGIVHCGECGEQQEEYQAVMEWDSETGCWYHTDEGQV